MSFGQRNLKFESSQMSEFVFDDISSVKNNVKMLNNSIQNYQTGGSNISSQHPLFMMGDVNPELISMFKQSLNPYEMRFMPPQLKEIMLAQTGGGLETELSIDQFNEIKNQELKMINRNYSGIVGNIPVIANMNKQQQNSNVMLGGDAQNSDFFLD